MKPPPWPNSRIRVARLHAYSERDRRRDKRLYAILSNKDDSGGAADPTIKDPAIKYLGND